MKRTARYIFRLIILVFVILIAGFLVLSLINTDFPFGDFSILVFCFAVITFLSVSVFDKGMLKEPEARTIHIIVALSLKMLLEMVLALVWFFIAKKNTSPSVIIFFVLYLAFSLFSIFYMLNALKNKSL